MVTSVTVMMNITQKKPCLDSRNGSPPTFIPNTPVMSVMGKERGGDDGQEIEVAVRRFPEPRCDLFLQETRAFHDQIHVLRRGLESFENGVELFPLRVVGGRGNTAQERLQHRAIGQHVTPEPRHDVPNLRELPRLLAACPARIRSCRFSTRSPSSAASATKPSTISSSSRAEYVERLAIIASRFELATDAIDATHALTAAGHNHAAGHVHADRAETLRVECEVVVQVTEDDGEPVVQRARLDACLAAEQHGAVLLVEVR